MPPNPLIGLSFPWYLACRGSARFFPCSQKPLLIAADLCVLSSKHRSSAQPPLGTQIARPLTNVSAHDGINVLNTPGLAGLDDERGAVPQGTAVPRAVKTSARARRS